MLWLMLGFGLQAAEVRGIVVDQKGRPIFFAGTTIDPRLSCCFTDKSGSYAFTTDAPFYVFRKAGYRSAMVQTRDGDKERVVLKRLTGQEAALPSCGRKAESTIGLDGSFFRFRDSTSAVTIERGADVDFAFRTYSVGKQSIRHGRGPTWSLGLPSIDLATMRLEEKVWNINGTQVIDARGENNDGRRWRFLGTFGETVEYRDVDPLTAQVFDKFLDSVCVTVTR